MIDDNLKMLLYEIARFCFRNVADNDYLSARILFRFGLDHQAYWFSEQAVEKYLKSILLFNELKTKSIGHDLGKALTKVKEIPNINFELPKDVEEVIMELNNEGNNRYFEYPYFFGDLNYVKLDRMVWYIRRYCVPIGWPFKLDDKEIDLQQFEITVANQEKYLKNPSKYSFADKGVLEKILKDKKSIKRKHLVWKNLYFGAKQKRTIRKLEKSFSFGKPPHFTDHYELKKLEEYVYFSKEILEYIKSRNNESK